MSYYNFHAKCKSLIETNHLIGASLFQRYHHISPALVLYFDNHKPIPIREYKWREYFELLKEFNIEIKNIDYVPSL